MTDTTKPATMREVFAQVQADMKLMLDPYCWELRIAGLQPQSYADGVLVVAAPNEHARQWCEIRLDRIISRELRARTQRPIAVRYVLRDGAPC